MRKKNMFAVVAATTVLAAGMVWWFQVKNGTPETEGYAEAEEKEQRALFVEDRIRFEYDILKDPVTGKIPDNAVDLERKEALLTPWRELSTSINQTQNNTYTVKGPTNLGGRTRAVVYDKRFGIDGNQVILAGGVSSGIFRSTNGGNTWQNVTPSSFIHNVTAIVQDPRPGQENTWYYGTGEGIGNSASGGSGAFFAGDGLYKSVNNGLTWSRVANFNSSDFVLNSTRDVIWSLAINPVNGDVYVAGAGAIFRSADGGNTWATVLGITTGTFNTSFATDVVITPEGRVYAALGGNVRDNTFDGVWTSASGDNGSYTRIASATLLNPPPGWNGFGSYGRVVLALAPSNPRVMYVMYWNNHTNRSTADARPEADFFKYTRNETDTDGVWEDRTANLPDEPGFLVGNDPFAVQTGYDLVVAVYPADENRVFIGGTNAYRSPDGFATASGVRIGGYVSAASYAQIANHHADSHWFAFNPNNPDEMMMGTDGGISLLTRPLFNTTWEARNNNYITYQYYYGALEQLPGSSLVTGGAQDNGTTFALSGSTAFNFLGGGDGCSVGILPGHYLYSTQNGSMRRVARQANGNLTGGDVNIVPVGSLPTTSLFVTLFHSDRDNPELLYYARANKIWRTRNASTVSTLHGDDGWGEFTALGVANSGSNSNIRCIQPSHGLYNSGISVLYAGNDRGDVYRIDDPANTDTTRPVVNISMGALPAGMISDIAVHPKHPERVLVTLSPYTVGGNAIGNVWYCHNTKAANPVWQNVEGTIPNQSARSAAIVSWMDGSVERTEYYVGTNTGLYTTRGGNDGIDPVGPGAFWFKEGQGTVNNAVVREIDVRHADNTLLIVTHGNGMFLSQVNQAPLPLDLISFAGRDAGKTVDLTWTADNIDKFSHFELERTEALNMPYSKLATISRPSYSSRESFAYSDADVQGKTQLYYRLKMVDADGRFAYSKVVAILRNGGADAVRIFPTLSKGRFAIVVPPQVNGKALVADITDLQGRRIRQMRLNSGSTAVDITGSPRGMYIVRLTDAASGKLLHTEKVVVE